MSSVLPGEGGGGGVKGLKMLLPNCKEKWSSPSTSLFSTAKVQNVFKIFIFGIHYNYCHGKTIYS